MAKTHLNVIKDHAKPMVRICYSYSYEHMYWTVAHWVKAFRVGWNETAGFHYTGQLSIPQHHVDIMSGLLSLNHHWTVSILYRIWSQQSCGTYWRNVGIWGKFHPGWVHPSWVPHKTHQGTEMELVSALIDMMEMHFCSILLPLIRCRYKLTSLNQSTNQMNGIHPSLPHWQGSCQIKVLLNVAYNSEGVILTSACLKKKL